MRAVTVRPYSPLPVARGIRVGLDRCAVCGTVNGRRLCAQCSELVEQGDREGLTDRAVEQAMGRFPILHKDPERYRAAALAGLGRRYFAALEWEGESQGTCGGQQH